MDNKDFCLTLFSKWVDECSVEFSRKCPPGAMKRPPSPRENLRFWVFNGQKVQFSILELKAAMIFSSFCKTDFIIIITQI